MRKHKITDIVMLCYLGIAALTIIVFNILINFSDISWEVTNIMLNTQGIQLDENYHHMKGMTIRKTSFQSNLQIHA